MRMQNKKTMEVEILLEALEIAREKTDLAHSVALGGRFPMKRVAEALTVSRSRLAERVKDPARGRPPRYSKAEDEALLPLIRDIIDHRLSYGYRRVCAVLNRRLKQEGHVRVNHKRVSFMACFGSDTRLPARPQPRRQGRHLQKQSSHVLLPLRYSLRQRRGGAGGLRP